MSTDFQLVLFCFDSGRIRPTRNAVMVRENFKNLPLQISIFPVAGIRLTNRVLISGFASEIGNELPHYTLH